MIYLLAYIGGIILNLMPCVLPVLMLKVMSLHRRRSWQYVAGVMSVFLTLGVAATGPGFIWGGQFDHAWFTWLIAGIVLSLGLFYLDVFQWPNIGCREAESDFGKGVLTTVLSSACSGPFLGAVFAASLTQPPWKIVTLFLTIGAGLVTPYLFFPRSWVPKPGDWMDTFRKLAGVSMIATAGWLLAGSTAALVVLIVLFWLRTLVDGRRRLALSGVYCVLLLALAAFTFLRQPYTVEKFDRDRFTSLVNDGRIVMIEFTSTHCLTCQFNQATMTTRSVSLAIQRNNVVVMAAVMPNGASLLQALGFTSVPVLAIFPGNAQPIVLPDVVTKSQIINAVETAHARISPKH